jgi:hypothetical protein
VTTGSPRYGIRAISWSTVQTDRYPGRLPDTAYWDGTEAAELNRLRGLVVVQAAETEAVLGLILSRLDPSSRIDQPLESAASSHEVSPLLGVLRPECPSGY